MIKDPIAVPTRTSGPFFFLMLLWATLDEEELWKPEDSGFLKPDFSLILLPSEGKKSQDLAWPRFPTGNFGYLTVIHFGEVGR